MKRTKDGLSLEYVDLEKLRPTPGNPKLHDLKGIRRSIETFGFADPIIEDDRTGLIVSGHGRREVLIELRAEGRPVPKGIRLEGRRWLVPIVRGFRSKDDAHAEALLLAVNQLVTRGGVDEAALGRMLERVRAVVDMNLLGFDRAQIQAAADAAAEAANAALGTEPALPERPENPTTKRGDLWLLGKHRLLCGDATSAEDVGRLLGGAHPFLMVTDPPYGVEYDPDWRAEAFTERAAARGKKLAGDDHADWTPAWRLFPGDVAYVWCASLHLATVHGNLVAAGFTARSLIVWRKPQLAISRGHYHWQHDPAWYVAREGAQSKWCGDRAQSTVWEMASPNTAGKGKEEDETPHSTQKPLDAMARPMRNHDGPGGLVYDPFVGSGTTVIAAEQSDRVAYALEIDPGYCDVVAARWEQRTGRKAERRKA